MTKEIKIKIVTANNLPQNELEKQVTQITAKENEDEQGFFNEFLQRIYNNCQEVGIEIDLEKIGMGFEV